ncbi:hypothetical protein RirG_084190 [Rhizophagus irregularis DAOM 197198w]|uniref:Uncharacterized protein n=1 Tax=Rhizophagus irregularis (strain DAOM 197198w) TaxID=1432141 RepID=A0A015LE33_RHIIW|nr:hypothetical protein RirG_084190 [Rhizophagus irregularis DAOM 197198w]
MAVLRPLDIDGQCDCRPSKDIGTGSILRSGARGICLCLPLEDLFVRRWRAGRSLGGRRIAILLARTSKNNGDDGALGGVVCSALRDGP